MLTLNTESISILLISDISGVTTVESFIFVVYIFGALRKDIIS